MVWRLEYLQSARKDIEQLDRSAANRIRRFIEDRLAQLDDPRSTGEALKGPKLGAFWKYRVGDYRIIASIKDGAMRILVVRIQSGKTKAVKSSRPLGLKLHRRRLKSGCKRI